MLYGAYSVADGRIYFGQTGTIQGETSVGNRFLQEVADARAWHKLYGSKRVKADHDRWQQYLTAGRITLHPLDALRILIEAKRALPPVKFSPLQTRLLAYWKAHTHFALPRSITLHVPFVTKTERLQLRKACAEFFRDTPYPRALGAYLAAVLGIPLTIPPKMLRVFCKDRLLHSSQHYLQAAQDTERCGCVKDLQAAHCEGACLFQKDTLVSQFGPRY